MGNAAYPYVKLREQADGTIRPRFTPGPRERALGFDGQDLRHPNDGPWYNRDEAATWARDTHARITAARDAVAAGNPPTPPTEPPAVRNCVRHLLADWLAVMETRTRAIPSATPRQGGRAKRMETISAASLRTYRNGVSAIVHPLMPANMRSWPKDTPRPFTPIATSPVRVITKPVLRAYHKTMWQERGLSVAALAISTLSAAITWAMEEQPETWGITANPRHGMKFAKPKGRISVYTRAEFNALVKAADDMGRPSIGDMAFLGMFTGQRVTDRLLLIDDGVEHGRRVLRQSKTGRVVKIKEAPQLTERLAQARARRMALQMKFGKRGDTAIVLDERTGEPYSESDFHYPFKCALRLAAAHVSSVATRTNQDFRDTFITSTYRAQMRAGRVDLRAIADCTGHSYASVAAIIDAHYLGVDPVAADGAIDLLSDFFETDAMNDGITPR